MYSRSRRIGIESPGSSCACLGLCSFCLWQHLLFLPRGEVEIEQCVRADIYAAFMMPTGRDNFLEDT